MSLLADQAKANPQDESAFLSRLPLEIRLQVYKELLPAEKQLWIRAVRTGGTNEGETSPERRDTPVALFEHYPAKLHLIRALYARNATSGYLVGGRTLWGCIDNEHEMHLINFEAVSLMLSCKRMSVITSNIPTPHKADVSKPSQY